jgi:outer membrane protein assembly factor BamE
MLKFRIIFWCLCLCPVLLSGCFKGGAFNAVRNPLASSANTSFVYRTTVQQGNILTQDVLNQVQVGLTREQVRYLLGTPLLTDVFHPLRWDYVYMIKRPHEPLSIQRLTIHFHDDQVIKIEDHNLPTSAMNEQTMLRNVAVPDWEEDGGMIHRLLNVFDTDTTVQQE